MKYLPVFALRVRHAFYADGACPDFTIDASEAGQRVLTNHRMIAKPRPTGIDVFTAVDSQDQPFIPFRDDMTLHFHLRLENPDFALFSDLSPVHGVTSPIYENSASNPEAGGELTLRAGSAPLPLPARASVFAEIRIRGITPAWLTGGPVQYTIDFQPKEARWTFYFVSDKLEGNGNGQTPTIVDDDPTRADAPLQFTTVKLEGDPDSAPGAVVEDAIAPGVVVEDAIAPGVVVDDAIARDLAARYPTHQRFRIISSSPLPCQQGARKRLALYLGDEKLSSALANPSLRNFSTLGIQGDSALERQESLFHVMKH